MTEMNATNMDVLHGSNNDFNIYLKSLRALDSLRYKNADIVRK